MAEKKKKSGEYSADSIQVLEGLEPVRKRPRLYIGGTSLQGLHHLIWEVVSNSIDEAMAGHGNYIEIRMLPDNKIKVIDQGRGIPVEKHSQTGLSTLETVLTKLHAGGKFGGGGYKVSGGLHGVGISVVNALSVWTKADVYQKGKIWSQEYSRGIPKGKIKSIGKTTKNGTVITFEPDPQIFPEIKWNWKTISNYLREQAYLTKGVHIKLIDERDDNSAMHRKVGYCFDGGIKSFVSFLNKGKEVINQNIFYAEKEDDGILVELSMQYHGGMKDRLMSFANNINTIEGGMHETGFRTALTRTINDYARKNNILREKDANLTSDDVREGITAIISVKLADPQFEGQTKSKLGNSEARTATSSVAAEALAEYFDKNPADAKAIINRCSLAARARLAAKAAKDAVIRKGALDGMTLPGKLSDCSSKKPEECEIFVVEGDSAGGSAKQGRDRRFQAILPIFGKILNIEKARIDKVIKNDKIQPLVIAMGAGIGESFNIEKLRYHRIVLMADADVDGAHIRTLYLTLFYRYFEELIKEGHIYIAQPPLYKIQKGKDFKYAFTDEEKELIIKEFLKKDSVSSEKEIQEVLKDSDENEIQEKSGIKIQRYKGLGEMNPDQLWETTMNPETRMMYQVAIEDAERADKIFDILMGSEVAPRKRFIQAHAKSVQNLDI
ncbi:MAG: DNA topoisomerase (ATP-hydrolyzing) subunit B [Patescibacteria group bacterium]|jgi:DNA gyrase subunit B|nr:DNA topoisomerase (ATP-hydrolyzing) subunit B [Patescibacteria group bacterium]